MNLTNQGYKKLTANVIVGNDLTNCLVLASHPDESRSNDPHYPSLTRRTIAMKFDGKKFGEPISLPFPINRGWSSQNGTGYVTPIKGNKVHVYINNKWQTESFSTQEENILRIWGISGSSSKDDFVYISTKGSLFIRENSRWTQYLPPQKPKWIYSVHGFSSDNIKICSDVGILLWNGRAFDKKIELPKISGPHPTIGTQSEVEEGWVMTKEILISGEKIYAGNDYLIYWTKATGWQCFEPKVPDITALIEVDSIITVGTFEKGVVELKEGSFVPATVPFMCLQIQQIGDGVFAMGKDCSFIRIQGQWQQLAMPSCEIGQLPQELEKSK